MAKENRWTYLTEKDPLANKRKKFLLEYQEPDHSKTSTASWLLTLGNAFAEGAKDFWSPSIAQQADQAPQLTEAAPSQESKSPVVMPVVAEKKPEIQQPELAPTSNKQPATPASVVHTHNYAPKPRRSIRGLAAGLMGAFLTVSAMQGGFTTFRRAVCPAQGIEGDLICTTGDVPPKDYKDRDLVQKFLGNAAEAAHRNAMAILEGLTGGADERPFAGSKGPSPQDGPKERKKSKSRKTKNPSPNNRDMEQPAP